MKVIVFLTVTFMGSMLLLSQTASAALVCKDNRVRVCGSWKRTMAGARGNARRAWKNEVRHRYGSCWHYWTRARDKRVECRSRRRDERCCYSARPCCRAGVVNSGLEESPPASVLPTNVLIGYGSELTSSNPK